MQLELSSAELELLSCVLTCAISDREQEAIHEDCKELLSKLVSLEC